MTFRIYSMALTLLLSLGLSAQSIGVRAGWNFSKFNGPVEVGESFKYNNGFHFGINYGYKFSNKLMLRTELLYNQVGNKQVFDGNSYYLIYTPAKTIFELGKKTLELEISNSYISLPFSAVYSPNRKIELFAGASMNFLISPTGRGKLRFESANHPDDIVFRQALDYRFYQDQAKAQASGNIGVVKIIVDDAIVNIPKTVGAYYQTDAKVENLFKWYNINVFGGANYFLNRGFYIGLRYEYGLMDVTNRRVDFSQVSLNPDYSLIKRDDKDKQITIQASMGFRF